MYFVIWHHCVWSHFNGNIIYWVRVVYGIHFQDFESDFFRTQLVVVARTIPSLNILTSFDLCCWYDCNDTWINTSHLLSVVLVRRPTKSITGWALFSSYNWSGCTGVFWFRATIENWSKVMLSRRMSRYWDPNLGKFHLSILF